MALRLRSLRFKLVLLNLAVVGAVQVLLAVLFLLICDGVLRSQFDRRLAQGAVSVTDAVDFVATETPLLAFRTGFWPTLRPFRFLEYYVQITAPDGSVIDRSANLGEQRLPLTQSSALARRLQQPVLETWSGERVEALVGPGQSVRLFTEYMVPAGYRPCFLQVAVSMASIDHALVALRRTLMRLLPIGLGVGAIASWLLARKALSPIGRVSREARRLTAARLSEPLKVPPGDDELTAMVVTLNEMLARLAAAFKAQERFVANAAHELRTPITHLLGQVQVLGRRERSAEDYGRFLTDVQGEMRHLASLVESLLVLARVDAGTAESRFSEVELNEVVADAVQQCHPTARERDVRVSITLGEPAADGSGPVVRGDAELLQVMVANLLRNAVRHAPVGSAVEVEVDGEGAQVVVAVCDRGPGIPDEHLPRIFERFYQVPGGEAAARGTGLGLSIAHSVARVHGGDLLARNRPGGGAEFRAILPLAGDSPGP